MRPLSPEEKIQRAGGRITVWKPRARPLGVDEARRRAWAIIIAFLDAVAAGMKPVHAMRVATGIGKTNLAAKAIAEAFRLLPGLYVPLPGANTPARHRDRRDHSAATASTPSCSAAAMPSIRTIRAPPCAKTSRPSIPPWSSARR